MLKHTKKTHVHINLKEIKYMDIPYFKYLKCIFSSCLSCILFLVLVMCFFSFFSVSCVFISIEFHVVLCQSYSLVFPPINLIVILINKN